MFSTVLIPIVDGSGRNGKQVKGKTDTPAAHSHIFIQTLQPWENTSR